jgi:hypothetical protein
VRRSRAPINGRARNSAFIFYKEWMSVIVIPGQAARRAHRCSTCEDLRMKKLFVASLLLPFALSLGGAAVAAEPTAQQNKMKTCNADATGKKGDERKAFMKECLSAKPAAAPEPKLTQQDKMKKCNADATGKKGDDRKTFMKACLSNK